MGRSSADTRPCALVVDDNGLIRMNAAYIMEDAGFRTFEAADGDDAITLLEQHHAEIVLLFTDVEMPGTRNGFAVAQETARNWPHIFIVVASGQLYPDAGEMPEGACFVTKPFTAQIVRRHLQRILDDDQNIRH